MDFAFLIEMRHFNIQDPTSFSVKSQTTKSTKPARTLMDQYKNNEFLQKFLGKSYDPASSDPSDEEDSAHHKECAIDKLEKEIEALFMSVKEQCEKDRIKSEHCLEDEIQQTPQAAVCNLVTPASILPAVRSDVINREKIEQKGGVKFVIRSSGPSKYFKPQEMLKKRRKRRRTRKSGNKRILSLLPILVDSGLSFQSNSFDYCNLTEILELSKVYVGYTQAN